MTEPRYEFWRTITPVVGEPVPECAESSEDGVYWNRISAIKFRQWHTLRQWRVPVEVIPLDVAVDAVCNNAAVCPRSCTWNVSVGNGVDGLVNATNFQDLTELVREALRKAGPLCVKYHGECRDDV